MKAYLLSFDPNFVSVDSVHAIVTSTASISEWWHYLSGAYIITSSADISALNQLIKPKWPGGWYILTEVKLPVVGMLTKDGWDWINSRIS